MNNEKAKELTSLLMIYYQKLRQLWLNIALIDIAIFHLFADDKKLLKNQSDYVGLNFITQEDLDEIIQFAYNDVKGDEVTITAQYSIVSGWALFEDFLNNIEILWLETISNQVPEKLKNIKLPLSDYYLKSKTELLEKAIRRKGNDINTKKTGIYKRLLVWHEIGMNFKPDVKMVQTIHEFNQFRNCIVHNQGKVTDHMVSECPWLNLNVGDNFEPDLSDFMDSLFNFAAEYGEFLKSENLLINEF